MERIKKEGRLKLIDSQYKKSIDYSLVTMEESIAFLGDVVHDMNIRQKVSANKILNQMCNEIRKYLEAKSKMELLIEQISHSTT